MDLRVHRRTRRHDRTAGNRRHDTTRRNLRRRPTRGLPVGAIKDARVG